MNRALFAVVLAACGGAAKPKPAQPTYSPATVEVAAESQTSLLELTTSATWSAGYEATSGSGGQPASPIQVERQELDVTAVVTLVQERLAKVAVNAAGDLLAKLGVQANRPWARDLLDVVARLAIASDADWRPAAEAGLRVIARVVVADALVRTTVLRGTSYSDADRQVVTDWAYWYLAQTNLLRDPIKPPTCSTATGKCVELRDAKPGGAAAKIDAELKIETVLKGVRLAGRLRAAHAESRLSSALLLEQLLSVKDLGSLSSITTAVDALKAKLDLKEVHKRIVAFEKQRQLVANVLNTAPPKLDDLKDQAAKLSLAIKATVKIDGVDIGLVELARRLLGERAAELYDDLMRELDAPTVDRIKATLALVQTQPLQIGTAADELRNALDELASLVKGLNKLDDLSIAKAVEFRMALERVIIRLQSAERLAALSPELGAAIRSFKASLQGLVVLIDRLRSLAELASGGTLGEAFAAVHSLGRVVGGNAAAPILDVVGPILDKLADGRRLTTADVFAAVSAVGPAELVKALGAEFDASTACKDDADGWKCWSVRLAMIVHGSLKFDGDSVAVNTGQVVGQVAKLGSERRKFDFLSLHLHASVGTGALYTKDQWRPLVAEQIGMSVELMGNDKINLAIAGYGSGLLYRFVLDDAVSDGVMFGGALVVRLYDLLELHGGGGIILVPGDTPRSTHGTFVLGAQVPLGDYLERLRR
jgi:hypothetical protein